ncbi:DUF748 domain-containing protein [Algoriphagus hitonicola]|uniref:AsmA-like C-terminal region n=1 Tax=Algoriphagus hitonicola TaxID=435880 RepID=A0A1I2TJY9_9BACT|nr:DUF748 domain-containing protein [Algoriphagus hitonicola]SFG65245.1 protein of unknown function [Algoriphagus hitonicola]
MKRILLGILVFLLLIVSANFGLEYWLESKVKNLLNADADRKYDLLFDEVNIDLLGRKIALNSIRLVPREEQLGIRVNGSIHEILFSDVRYWDLLLKNQVSIGELYLREPSFRLVRQDSTFGGKDNSKAFQDLFGDLIKRGKIEDFKLSGGTAELFFGQDSLYRFGQFTDLTIHAMGLKTDSLILTNPVPFEVEQITSSLKNFTLYLTEDQTFSIKSFDFDYRSKTLLMEGLSLTYDLSLQEIAQKDEFQRDVIAFELKRFEVEKLDANSNLYGNWTIIAGLASLDSLILRDLRDKNIPVKPEDAKPMFAGMLKSLPLPLKIDQVTITNSSISYSEIGEGESEPVTLSFENLNAEIQNLVSIDSLQNKDSMKMKVTTDFMGNGAVEADFVIPFDQSYFDLDLTMGQMDLVQLNSVIGRLAQMRIESGQLQGLKLEMRAQDSSSENKVWFDYSDLKIEILNGEKRNRKNGLLTMMAGLAISKENRYQDKNYKVAQFRSQRNPYRGPFNFMWENTKTGLEEIIPSGAARFLQGK